MDTKIKEIVLTAAQNLDAKILWQDETIGLDVPCGEGRTQVVMIVEVEGKEYIRIFSLIARFQNLDPVKALRLNMTFTDSAFAITDGDLKDGLGKAPTLVMVTTQRIATADLDEVQSKIKKIATLADGAEEQITGGDIT